MIPYGVVGGPHNTVHHQGGGQQQGTPNTVGRHYVLADHHCSHEAEANNETLDYCKLNQEHLLKKNVA